MLAAEPQKRASAIVSAVITRDGGAVTLGLSLPVLRVAAAVSKTRRPLSKASKTRGHFPDDDSGLKLLRLIARDITTRRGGDSGTRTIGWNRASMPSPFSSPADSPSPRMDSNKSQGIPCYTENRTGSEPLSVHRGGEGQSRGQNPMPCAAGLPGRLLPLASSATVRASPV